MPANATSITVKPISRRSTHDVEPLRNGRGQAEGRQQVGAPSRDDEGRGAADQREEQALDGELADDARAAGAERRADADLALTIRRAREEERRDVEAGDEQHQTDDGERDPRDTARAPGPRGSRRPSARTPACAACSCPRDPRRQPRCHDSADPRPPAPRTRQAPDGRRPSATARCRSDSRDGRFSVCMRSIGIQTSGSYSPPGPWNPSGRTPTIETIRPLR